MSIASELQNYADGLDDAYDAVNDMSGIVPAHKNMNNLDQAIRTIPQNTGITATTFHWGGSPNYSMYKDSGYTTAATYSDIATAYADGLVYIADGEDEVNYVVVSDIPDAYTITVTGIGLPDHEGASASYAYASSTWTKTATEFQKKLTAGTNIAINGTTISATDTTYSDMVGATSLDAGTHGLVPAPAAGDESKVLSGAGTWVNQPTVPTVNNATLTIQRNSTTVKTFTANASSDVTCDITVPTQFSDLTGTVSNAQIADGAVTKAKTDDSGLKNPTVTGAYCYYRRSGHFVWVSGNASGYALTANSYKTIFTLPSGYRPPIDIYCPLGLSSATAMGILRIKTSGEVQGWAATNTSYWNFSTTFAIS